MRLVHLIAAAGLVACMVACSKSKPASEAPPTPPPAAEPAPPPAPPPAAATVTQRTKAPVPAIAEAGLRALLDAWLAAQNGGDFEAYSALYADRFFGTKRSGDRTRSFERKAWLRDRKRMFGKAMNVTAADVVFNRTAGSAVLTFQQTWASGTYKDVGPKQLVVVPVGTELRIAREEMLSSVVEKGGHPIKPLARQHFAFVIHQNNAPYVVLHLKPKNGWSEGKLELLSSGASASVRQPAIVSALPEDLRGWAGAEVDVHGSAGRVCGGKVNSLYLLSRVEPHFGTVQYWDGHAGDPPAPQDKIASEAWDLGRGGRLLVGHVEVSGTGDCAAGFWARAAGQPEPLIARSTSADPLLVRAALQRFRKLRGHAAVQKAYMEEVPTPRKQWWDGFQDAAPEVTVFQDAAGAPGWIAIGARAGDGCGEFMGEYWALWRVRPARDPKKPPALALLTDEADPGRYFQPRLAVDLDRDGKMEFIGVNGLLQSAGPILRESESVEVPNLDCPC